MKTLLVVILVLVFLASVLLDKAYRAVSVKELKRRARGTNDSRSARIYKLASYGDALEIFLWLVGGASSAWLFILAARYAWWLALVVVLVAMWWVWLSRPLGHTSGLAWSLAAGLATPATTLIGLAHPLLRRIAHLSNSLNKKHSHTGLYEREDLVDFIKSQSRQADNRIHEEDLGVAHGALTFGDKSVGSVMTPKSQVRMVAAGDPIGPHLMDELHASGFSRFPVVKNLKDDAEVIGTLYLKDVVDHPEVGHIRDVMKHEVYFINETQNLREALAAFLKTQAYLLIVVNNFEEMAGVLSIEDVLQQILGQKLDDEFEHYDDMRSVAGIESHKEHQHSNPEVVE